MAKNDFDATLLGKLAGSLDEIGEALRVMRVEGTTNSKDIATVLAEVRIASDRIKALEKSLNGNGQPGLKTEVAQVKSRQDELEKQVAEITEWRNTVSQKKIDDLTSKAAGRPAFWISVIGILVALAVGVPACMPIFRKILIEKPAVEKAKPTDPTAGKEK